MKNLKTTIVAVALGLLPAFSFAGECNALNGEYRIGKNGGDYATINEAVTALKCGGVSGPVTFLLEDGKYSERVTISSIPGTSAVNTVRFESAKGVSSDVVLSSNTPDAEWTVGLLGASNIIFENVTIENKTGNTGNVVRLDGECSNVKFKNVAMDGAETRNTGALSAVIYSTGNMSKSDIVVEDCEINNGSLGIYKGSETSDKRTSIIGTIFFSQYEAAISLNGENAPIISNNVISTISNYNGYKALSLNDVKGNLIVSNNVINAVYGNYGLYMKNCIATLENYGTISNNSINVGGNSTMYGLYLDGNTNNQVFNFNRVKLTPTDGSSSNQAYYKNNSDGANINLMNNIFFDLNSGGYTILGNTYKDYFNQLPSQSNASLSVSANGIMIEKVMPAN